MVMKVAFNKKLVDGPYGGGNQVLRLLKKHFEDNGISVSFSLDEDVDVIMLMDVRDGGCIFPLKSVENFKKSHPKVKILHRINENDAHRAGSNYLNALILQSNKLADVTVFVSEWLKSYFQKFGMSIDESKVIPNGADRNLFFNAKIKRYPSETLRIVTHHMSDNILKGYPTYRALDEFCFSNPSIAKFQFIGRPLPGFIKHGEVISQKKYEDLAPLLQKNHLYITASMYEPGPNHLPEGMACGLIPLVFSSSTSCVECSNGFNVLFDDHKDLFLKIEELYCDANHYNEMKDRMSLYDYGADEMCAEYHKIIEGIIP
jgi:glycosyltransferase involved in cell wall biosynthesis